MSGVGAGQARLLNPTSTAAVVLGAHDWTEAGLGRAPSFLRSARRVVRYLYNRGGLGLDPELVLDLFDDNAAAGDQLARMRDTLDIQLRERRDTDCPVTDVLLYYVGHGHTDDQGQLSLLVRRSRKGLEAETGIKATDLARALRLGAPSQRRSVILDCCFSEAAARAFVGMAGDLTQAVAAAVGKDLRDDHPARGTLLLCSSPSDEVSMGAPNAECTLFTGAVLGVLEEGAEGRPPYLSFADLRDAAFDRMVVTFGANSPRPVLHQVSAAKGDLTRAPAFPNCATTSAGTKAPPTDPPLSEADRAQRALEIFPPRSSDAELPDIRGNAAGKLSLGDAGIANDGSSLGVPSGAASEEAERLRQPTEQANGNAQADLGFFHETGRGAFPKDDQEAARLYKLSADQGNAHGQASLGIFYRDGRGGLPKDEREAVRLFKLAADQGDARGQVNLALLYADGRGVISRNEREAARLFRLAANQGNAAGQTNLGVFYRDGRGGLPKDDHEAARLFKLSAEQGNAGGSANLGFFYANGRGGLPKDDREAARLYRLSANQGNAWAKQALRIQR